MTKILVGPKMEGVTNRRGPGNPSPAPAVLWVVDNPSILLNSLPFTEAIGVD